jgi:hypothetical protein
MPESSTTTQQYTRTISVPAADYARLSEIAHKFRLTKLAAFTLAMDVMQKVDDQVVFNALTRDPK